MPNIHLTETPKKWSSKIVIFVTFTKAFVLHSVYAAFVYSYLTRQAPSLPFSDLETFAIGGSFKLAVIKNGIHYDILLNRNEAEDSTIETLRNLLSKDLPDSEETALSQVEILIWVEILIRRTLHTEEMFHFMSPKTLQTFPTSKVKEALEVISMFRSSFHFQVMSSTASKKLLKRFKKCLQNGHRWS